MSSPAKKFILNRSRRFALTLERVHYLFSYIQFCHNKQLADGAMYSRDWVKSNTSDKYENYLKKRLVHDYLKRCKKLFPPVSSIEDILFECEPEMPYQLMDKHTGSLKEANDRIDIKINRIGLQHIWNAVDEQDIYLAIECKIVSSLGDNAAYLGDIQKFCDREHLHFRLPIEGMIAFKEARQIGTADFVIDLNNRLAKNSSISTVKMLETHESFSDYYLSTQRRNFGGKIQFSICHLYLDYSSIIAN